MTGLEIIAAVKAAEEAYSIAKPALDSLGVLIARLRSEVTVADIIQMQAADDQAKYEEEGALEKEKARESEKQVATTKRFGIS